MVALLICCIKTNQVTVLTDRASHNGIKTSGFNFTHYVKVKFHTDKTCTCIIFSVITLTSIKVIILTSINSALSSWQTPIFHLLTPRFHFSLPFLKMLLVRSGAHGTKVRAWRCTCRIPSTASLPFASFRAARMPQSDQMGFVSRYTENDSCFL